VGEREEGRGEDLYRRGRCVHRMRWGEEGGIQNELVEVSFFLRTFVRSFLPSFLIMFPLSLLASFLLPISRGCVRPFSEDMDKLQNSLADAVVAGQSPPPPSFLPPPIPSFL
jgi:hypothetical protein